MRMSISTSTFTINEGSTAGIYCAHCGERMATITDEVGGEFHYHCPCVGAASEMELLILQEDANTNYEEFMRNNRERMVENELRGKLKYHETAVLELQTTLGIAPHQSKAPSLSELLKNYSTDDVRQYVKERWDELF